MPLLKVDDPTFCISYTSISQTVRLHNGVARGKGGSTGGQSGGGGKKGAKSQNGGDKGRSGISRLMGAVKLQSAPGADNPCYTTAAVRSAGWI